MKSNIAIAIHVQKNFIDDKEKYGVKQKAKILKKNTRNRTNNKKPRIQRNSIGDTAQNN